MRSCYLQERLIGNLVEKAQMREEAAEMEAESQLRSQGCAGDVGEEVDSVVCVQQWQLR